MVIGIWCLTPNIIRVASCGILFGFFGGLILNGYCSYLAGVALTNAIGISETFLGRKIDNYDEVAEVICGKLGKRIVNVCFVLMMFSLCSMYLLLMAFCVQICVKNVGDLEAER